MQLAAGRKKTEVRSLRSEIRGQMTDDRGQGENSEFRIANFGFTNTKMSVL